MKRVTVVRCPRCGSTDAGADESRSAYEFTYMQCHGCGEGGLQDPWQVSFDWNLEIEIADDATEIPARVTPLEPD